MTLQDKWRKAAAIHQTEVQRLWKSASNQAMASLLIGKVKELTGETMSLRDAISHLATIKANKSF